mgnify:CR=1 FL=1
MKIIKILLFISIFFCNLTYADINTEFENWKKNFKKVALSKSISEETFNLAIENTKYLPNVIKYDRYQPEFYEDTKTYISKRASLKKLRQGLELYEQNQALINKIEKEFQIEKLNTNFVKIVDWISVPLGVATLLERYSDVDDDSARFALAKYAITFDAVPPGQHETKIKPTAKNGGKLKT